MPPVLSTKPTVDEPKMESNGKSSNDSNKKDREPLLQANDSLEKVIQVLDSISVAKSKPSIPPSNENLSKGKLNLNAETLLILNLLGMNSAERHEYLIAIAQQRKLLLTNKKSNTFSVNPDLIAVGNIPQVIDFVHQFQGKPIPPIDTSKKSDLTEKTARKLNKKLKKKEKQQILEKLRPQKNNDKKIIVSLSSAAGAQHGKRVDLERQVFANARESKIIQSKNIPIAIKSEKVAKSHKVSSQSASTSNLTNIVETSKGKQRTHSVSESMIAPASFRPVNISSLHQHDVGEAFSKRQQKRLRKQLKQLSIQSVIQANVEKAPRKRGRRGSKKGADEVTIKEPPKPLKATVQTNSTLLPTMSKTDIAAKNLIRSKCSQINAKIQEKLNLCASTTERVSPGPGPSKLMKQTVDYDLVIDQSEGSDDESSSVISDSSTFPTDEDTTSYLARSDEIESSCNEKRLESTLKLNLSIANEGNELNGEVTAVSSN